MTLEPSLLARLKLPGRIDLSALIEGQDALLLPVLNPATSHVGKRALPKKWRVNVKPRPIVSHVVSLILPSFPICK